MFQKILGPITNILGPSGSLRKILELLNNILGLFRSIKNSRTFQECLGESEKILGPLKNILGCV